MHLSEAATKMYHYIHINRCCILHLHGMFFKAGTMVFRDLGYVQSL